MSFNRVLPVPQPVYHDPATGRDFTRRGSSLLEHRIMNGTVAQESTGGEGSSRRNSIASDRASINSQASRVNSYQLDHRDEDGSPLSHTRKRTASLMSFNPSPVAESLSKSTSVPSSEIPTHFCLCQPDPKIPRPRNAFILYRQHYQGAVVAKNPGLANPDISKIIGEQWRQLPADTKNEWKNLAEEEKARHQQQYPEYRYRPRRYGRNNPAGDQASVTTSNGINQCTRCGGRIMATPNTPSTPFSPDFRGAPPPNAPPSTPARHHPGMGPRSPGFPVAQRAPTNGAYPRRDIGPPPLSPDAKRRRFNPPPPFPPPRREMSPETPYPPYVQRRVSDQRAQYVQTPRTVAMGPPPRPQRLAQSPHDPSLTLPPIQTSASAAQQSQKSVEAMVMTIPFLNKINVLSKITPPLGKPSPTSPPFPVRGGIIAIEGSNAELVKTMVTYLESILAKTDEPIAAVKIFPGPNIDGDRNVSSASENVSSGASGKMADATVKYLDVISTWHKISENAAQYITTLAVPPQPRPSTPTSQTASTASPRTIIPKTKDLSIESRPVEPAQPLPIALIPRYQLTTSDHHAVRIPIDDQYSPFDHWQWVATLWRGSVGPDMTIVVRECERDEYDRVGGVEIRMDANVLVARLVKDKNGSHQGFEDRVLRRLGFEVEEWVRARKEGKSEHPKN